MTALQSTQGSLWQCDRVHQYLTGYKIALWQCDRAHQYLKGYKNSPLTVWQNSQVSVWQCDIIQLYHTMTECTNIRLTVWQNLTVSHHDRLHKYLSDRVTDYTNTTLWQGTVSLTEWQTTPQPPWDRDSVSVRVTVQWQWQRQWQWQIQKSGELIDWMFLVLFSKWTVKYK